MRIPQAHRRTATPNNPASNPKDWAALPELVGARISPIAERRPRGPCPRKNVCNAASAARCLDSALAFQRKWHTRSRSLPDVARAIPAVTTWACRKLTHFQTLHHHSG